MEDVSMITADSPAILHPHTFLSPRITHITDQITFAPTAATKRVIPRAWECVPSRAFLARHKSRQIWKRFRMDRERTGPAVSKIEEKEFQSEINTSANADYMRAVKRQRLQVDNNEDAHMERGRSFLETKWELEPGKRRRKLVTITREQEHGQLVSFDEDAESEGTHARRSELLEEAGRLTSLGEGTYAIVDVLGKGAHDNNDSDSSQALDDVNPTIKITDSEAAAEIAEIVARQEPSLVRSTLRMNSLDGEDVALLSEFLSRAQAKRAANAAMIPNKAEKATAMNSPMIRSRKALEEVDKNSPSPQKPQISTPVKAVKSPEPSASHAVTEDAASQASPLPTGCRRSTRTQLPKTRQAQSQRPAVPNQIPVRRANGTEFVFLQRTEAQELALLTRKNTRRNKGNAVLPKEFLQNYTKREQSNEDKTSSQPSDEEPVAQLRRSPRKHPGSRQVWWRDEKLVEYAPERLEEALDALSPEKKSGKGDNKASSRDKQETKTHALPATPSKKVRKINMPAPASTKPTINKPLAVGTPVPKRKKLTPKAPNTGPGTDSTGLSSRRPAKVASETKIQEAVVNRSTASAPKPPATQKASGIPKSKSLLKAPTSTSTSIISTAGATPVAKRVRAKKTAA